MPVIMIIDDRLDGALLLKAVLRRAGFGDIHVLTDPVAALESCQRSAPDVLITDLRMPGMNGLEMLEALRATLPPARFPATMVVSGDDAPETARQALERGAERFLVKPIDIRDLVTWVQDVIEVRKHAA